MEDSPQALPPLRHAEPLAVQHIPGPVIPEVSHCSEEYTEGFSFVGGKTRTNYFSKSGFRKLAHGPATGKTTVFGLIQRGEKRGKSRVRAFVVPNHKASVLIPKIYGNVQLGSVLYTDALRSYRQTAPDYVHAFVDHSIRYVDGRVHTNNIENFWSCLKRTIKGTYIAPRPFHLDRYIDEQVFRFNARETDDAGRFVSVLKGADGRRVTYRSLKTENVNLRAPLPR